MSIDCYCDFEPADFHREQIRTARKAHRCYECSGLIAPGEKYEHVTGKWDGGPIDTFKTCERCYDLRTWVKNNVPCFCWYHGSMKDDAEETINDAAWRAKGEAVGLRFGFLRRKVMAEKSWRKAHV